MQAGSSNALGNVLRGGLVLLGVLTCLKVWLGPLDFTSAAQAQIPDAGTQRLEMAREVRQTNELLREILGTLRNETLKVEIRGTDNTRAPAVRVRKSKGR